MDFANAPPMKTTKKHWERFLKRYFAFWKTNRCGLTLLQWRAPRHTSGRLELNGIMPFNLIPFTSIRTWYGTNGGYGGVTKRYYRPLLTCDCGVAGPNVVFGT